MVSSNGTLVKGLKSKSAVRVALADQYSVNKEFFNWKAPVQEGTLDIPAFMRQTVRPKSDFPSIADTTTYTPSFYDGLRRD